ncbi:zinc ribbon domain-containing protein [Caballeronia sp. LZ062]|uniref:FmdB family zinc ribbon protein n=1 Tax=unclassified Caballeronia TaxID=2646786 RepID=UPI002865E375|nr:MULTISPECIES: FmdB family zinc ribbon protein [unclassified Caballeronia]MDR5853554.1 zinc ribbon domain-containing protein [Caballeronia sp. LZ050]MDR5871912.1 zinc ribbon domain-containing protein [Caballeronia sp. LZ062]
MPIYAYRCASCGHEKDVLQKLSDAPLTQCPACGKDAFSKQVTAAGFQLKGSGWYVTDFRGGSNGSAAPKSGDNAQAASGSGDSNSGDSAKAGTASSSDAAPKSAAPDAGTSTPSTPSTPSSAA